MLTLKSIIQTEDLPLVLDLVKKLFEVILTWLNILPNYKESLKELKVNYLYVTDLASAIANCGSELGKMLGQCFGMCKRANEFYMKFP